MGSGIRPKGSFSYADLRYPEAKPRCENNRKECPSRFLCKGCVHAPHCADETKEKPARAKHYAFKCQPEPRKNDQSTLPTSKGGAKTMRERRSHQPDDYPGRS